MVLLFHFVDPTNYQKRGAVMETPALSFSKNHGVIMEWIIMQGFSNFSSSNTEAPSVPHSLRILQRSKEAYLP